jgi:glutamate-1-semialdehyde 2,1-aminomutase
VAPFNDLAAVESLMTAHGDDVAAIFVEPIAGNMGCVPPVPGFLEGLRALCDKHGAMLVFDEVMTGFRVSPNCAQGLLGVKPDLTTLGKIVGGGMPMGVVCGPRELMENFSPTGAVYQAGTLSGNPLSVAAGIALLTKLREDSSSIYSTLDQRGQQLQESWKSALDSQQIPHSWHRVGSMFGLFFTDNTVTNFKEAATADEDLFKRFFHGMLEKGIAIAPSSYEAGFVSLAHSEEDIAITAEAINALEL